MALRRLPAWHCMLSMCSALLAGPALAAEPPIVIGSVSTLSGPAANDAWRAAQAYFDAVNEAGGVHGRKLVYQVLDDQADPAQAQAAARRLVADPRVVVLGGGSSVLECGVNAATYAAAGLLSVPAGGVDPACFRTPAIAPVNAGPYVSTANALLFARQVLQHQRLCVVAPSLPGMVAAYQDTVRRWHRAHGGPAPALLVYRVEEPLSDVVRQVQAQACQALVFTGAEGMAIAWLQQARPQLAELPHIFLTAAYTKGVLKALGARAEGIYAMAEFEPWSSRSLPSSDWRQLIRARGLETSSLSQGGYLAAQLLVRTLRGIRGPVTRAAVAAALKGQAPQRSPLLDEEWVFGPADSHQANRSGLAMRVLDGGWRVAHPFWLRDSAR